MAAQLPRATPQLTAVEETLKLVQEQLTCSICGDEYTDPKVLRCFHVFCTKCLDRIVKHSAQGQAILCPICRQPIELPQNGVPGLQGAFYVHHLFDIRDTLSKVNKANCDKCKKHEASSYCRSCGFVCERCKEFHQFFDELSSHEVIGLDKLTGDLTKVVPPQKKVLNCSMHKGKELELFCETCSELICHNCTTKIHKGHSCDVVSDTFETHKAEVVASLKPVQQQLKMVKEALEQVNLRRKQVTDQQANVEAEISAFAQKLIAAVNTKKQALFQELAKTTHQKLKTLSTQEDEIQMVQARLSGCLEVVDRSLQTGTQGEVLAAKKAILKKVCDLTADFQPDSLIPQEQPDMRLAPSHAALTTCQKFGDLYADPVCPQKCTLQGVPKLSFVQKKIVATLQTITNDGRKSECTHHIIECTLVSSDSTTTVNGTVKKTGMGQYELCCTPTKSGQYQLHVKVEGQPIQASPFGIAVVKDLSAPIRTIGGVKQPWGVAINKKGQIIVSEYSAYCVTILSGSGDKITSFGSCGSAPGRLISPRRVAVDEDDNILIADRSNHCIHKFSPQGKFLETIGKEGKEALEFNMPSGMGIHPLSKKLYVTESVSNHRVQVLDASLHHVTMFGGLGNGDGKFNCPWGISFDTAGNCYVADQDNHRVQVFTEDSRYLRQFGKKGKGEGELAFCIGIAIDSNNIVYIVDRGNHRVSVFTTEGCFITSFGTKGSEPGQFSYPHGITIDRNGLVYVCDHGNNRIQVF